MYMSQVASNTEVTRKELYNMVWTQPLTTLAKNFDISDVGLRKICVKMDIPLPKAGYWMKKKYNKKIKQAQLPVNHAVKDQVVISPTSPDVREVYSQISEQRLLQQKIEDQLGDLLVVPDSLAKPDELILNTKKYLSGKITYRDRINNNMPVLDISVTKPNLERAYKFFDTFIKALRKRGHEIIFKNGSPYVSIKEIPIKIYVKEKEKRVVNTESKYSFDKYILVSTGLLYLRIKENYHSREFKDGKQTIEQQMSRIIAALEIEADKEIVEQAERKKWHEEYERKRLAELAIEKAKQQEKEKFALLLEEAKRFQDACSIRSYVNEVHQKALKQETINEELTAWSTWALQKADWLDPTVKTENTFL